MYVPAHFAETRPEDLARIIREYPLGVLVTHDAHGLELRGNGRIARCGFGWRRSRLGRPRQGNRFAWRLCRHLARTRQRKA